MNKLIQQEEAYFKPNRLQYYLQYYVLKAEEKYSLSRTRGNKKIIPLPHQIEAVYSRMLQSPRVRYLLADNSGADKTIMPGMLIRGWQVELYEKFDEDFVIVNRNLLNSSGDINPFEAYDKIPLFTGLQEKMRNHSF